MRLSLLSLSIFLFMSACHANVVPAEGPDASVAVDAALADATPAADDAAMTPDGSIPPTTAVLTWDATTMNTDGTPITDLAGYYVYHGMISPITTTNSMRIDVGNVLTYTFTNLVPGKHDFAVSAYATDGTESAFSVTAEKDVP